MLDRVVLISLDTLRGDCVGVSPHKLWPHQHRVTVPLRTEVLDELATGGCFFANCVSAAPYTSASHATILSGRWPLHHGVFELFNRKLRSPTLFDYSKRLGLRTVLKVDFPLILGPALGFTRGVDDYLVEDDEAFLAALDDSAPIIGLAHFGGIHSPYGFHNLRFGGQAFVDKVVELEAELPASARLPGTAPRALEAASETDLLRRYRRALAHHYENEDYDRLFSLYLEGIEHFLRTRFAPFLERLLAKLDGTSFLIVLFGDHGEEFDRDSFGHQSSVADGVLRVPLVFFGEGCAAATHLGRVRTVDAAPTVLEALGYPALGRLRLDGTSLLSTVASGADYPVRTAYAQSYVANDAEYIDFVKKLLVSGRKHGSLKHELYKECVYDRDLKLSRRHFDYVESDGGWRLLPVPTEAILEREVGDGTWSPVGDTVGAAELSGLLDAYNGG